MEYSADTLTLVADIGGTNTRVALAEGQNVLEPSIKRYANRDFGDLATVLERYIKDQGDVRVNGACVAVAGPVRNNSASMTNLDWKIDIDTLAQATSTDRVAILNDLQAQGHAMGLISKDRIRNVLNGPSAEKYATRLVVGVGTGFNAAPVFDGLNYRLVTPSEAGHTNLTIACEKDQRLGQFVSSSGFAAIEDALSGRGLERIYDFVTTEAGQASKKSAANIMAACADQSDAFALTAAKEFSRLLGIECGNLALTYLPFGGIYLVGGVSRAFASYLKDFGFEEAFKDKGRFAEFMQSFPVSVVEDDYAALTGSAAFLMHQSPST